MLPPIDEATSQFLRVAAQDLQQRLPVTTRVDDIWIAEAPKGVWLTARLLIEVQLIEVSGYGADLVAAYADLRTQVAEAALVTTYRALAEA